MTRITVLTLLLFGIAVGSCPPDAPVTANTLPHVGAPPPEFAAGAEGPIYGPAGPESGSPARYAYDAETQLPSPGESFTARAIETYLAGRHTGLSTREIRELSEVIVEEAERHGLKPSLVLAVIHVESSSYHRAVSSVGALGLMQILPSTAEELATKQGIPWLGREMLFDPVINVTSAHLLDRRDLCRKG